MFEGFEVSGGQINPDLLDFSYPPYFPVEFFLDGSEHGSYHMGTGIQKSRPADQLRPHVPWSHIAKGCIMYAGCWYLLEVRHSAIYCLRKPTLSAMQILRDCERQA